MTPAPDYQPGHVLEAKSGGYLVLSRTREGCWWFVFGDTCTCDAGRRGLDNCWHRAQVTRFCRALDDALNADRPKNPPAQSSMFVD